MSQLSGFHLRMTCAATDLPIADAVFQAELRALLHPFSLNDAGASDWKKNWQYDLGRYYIEFFIPLYQAGIPAVWHGVVGWLKGQPGRMLRIRFNDTGGIAQSPEEILPLLEEVLRELKALVQKTTTSK
ncbi:hypothetical protein F8N49_07595 [Pseudomonas sp. GXM4]|uniref:hypothetical protein n=1 Tax=Pseudomonas TaxID=286 RepID=UPI000BA452F2|nr:MULTISPECIES: hypothetical protein [Pseudomonas]KAB2526497.1 hypothetical protein F8N49_07595 [Pseudomonas sp. GXM4]MBJ7370683.1 hypothetical protein [Pseudomonas sp.]WGT34309.1 hypothetical protein QG303_01770 [Pseudomonas atacamensis]